MKGTGCSFDVVGMIHSYPYATIGDTVSFDDFFWGGLAKRSPIQVRSKSDPLLRFHWVFSATEREVLILRVFSSLPQRET